MHIEESVLSCTELTPPEDLKKNHLIQPNATKRSLIIFGADNSNYFASHSPPVMKGPVDIKSCPIIEDEWKLSH